MRLLVTPNIKHKCYSVFNEFSSVHPSMEAAILHSYFVNVKKIDCTMIHMEADQIDTDSLIRIINSGSVDEVWIICAGTNPSASTMTMPASIQLCARLKATTKAKIVMYGGHPTSLPGLTQQQSGCDEVIIGDGIDCDADEIPMVDWEKIDPKKYKAHNWHRFDDVMARWNYAAVWTTLGCPYNCRFCAVKNLYGTKPFSKRKRSIEKVVEEIEILNKKFGVHNLRIADELFTYDLERVNKFCDLLKDKQLRLNMWCYSRVDTVDLKTLKNLKSVGVSWVAYGFESFNQETLDDMNKRTRVEDFSVAIANARTAGINIIADVIAGFPGDDYPALERLYKFLEDNLFEMINLYPLFNLPGTELFQHDTTDWCKYQLYGKDCEPSQTRYLSSKQVLEWRDMAFNRYMTSPSYLNMIETKFGSNTKEYIRRMMRPEIRT